jgi:hypothetical protein
LTTFHGWLDPTIIYRDPVDGLIEFISAKNKQVGMHYDFTQVFIAKYANRFRILNAQKLRKQLNEGSLKCLNTPFLFS